MVYATRSDVYAYGLPRGSLYLHARAVDAVDVAANVLVIEGHGCDVDTTIQFTCDEGGSLAAPLTSSAVYYAEPVSDSLLRVRASAGGSPIDITSTGYLMHLVVPIGPQMDALRETFSRWLDTMLPGHTVPLVAPYPRWATYVVAVRTAAALARALGMGASGERIYEAEREAIADAQRLTRGVPLRDATATADSNLARGVTPAAPRTGSVVP